MNTDDEASLLAYVDGELDAAARAQFEARMALDDALTRQVESQRRLRERLASAYDSTLQEPVPERLLQAARGVTPAKTSVTELASARRSPSAVRRSVPTWLALAASLVLGVIIGQRYAPTSGALVVADAGGTVARADLANALDAQLSSQTTGSDGPVRIGLSYLSQSGEYCRTFAITRTRTVDSGVACRNAESQWRIAILEATPATAGATGNVRQASSADLPESVRRAVEANIVGDALDATAEAAAREAGWRPRSAQ